MPLRIPVALLLTLSLLPTWAANEPTTPAAVAPKAAAAAAGSPQSVPTKAAAAPKPAARKARHAARKTSPARSIPRAPASKPRAPSASKTPAPAAHTSLFELSAQRDKFRAAYAAAERGPDERWRALATGLEDYPLWPYLEAAGLLRDLGAAKPEAVERFLGAHGDSPLGQQVRRAWLRELAEHQHWEAFGRYSRAEDGEIDLRCHALTARIAQGAAGDLAPAARALLRSGRDLPNACAPVEAWAQAQGLLSPEFLWQRVQLAIDARNVGLIRALANALPADQRAEALGYAGLVADPAGQLDPTHKWADSPRARGALAAVLARVAVKDSGRTIAHWQALSHWAWSDAERGKVLAAIALDRAASYAPDAAAWLAQVPLAARDDRLREWRVREALARSDYAAARAAAAELSPQQKVEPRWQYLAARVDELDGHPDAARETLRELAGKTNFFGFLAADRLDLPYALCPIPAAPDAATLARIAAVPGLRRAFELHDLGWADNARREWDYAVGALDPPARAAAVAQAIERGWNDRGPFTLTRTDEQRLYALRFPLAHRELIERAAAQHDVDPNLVLGVIRTESAWAEDAVSSAHAQGLMQVLPSLAGSLAKREKLRYAGPADLDRPDLNVALGTRHLADTLAHYDGAAWLALAAYNAGPTPVARWRNARGSLPPDLWVETIPYKETREYVERVLAFAVIYGWRREGQATALSVRMAPPSATPAAGTAPRAISCVTQTLSAEAAR